MKNAALLLAFLLTAPAWTPQERGQTFLGFRLGEEVRYAFERESGQSDDRTVHWGITLQEISDDGTEGTFELSYIVVVARQRLAQSIAEARINGHGFPVRVRFSSERATPVGNIGYTIEYRFEGEEFRKELSGSGLGEQGIELGDHTGVDTTVPRGLYLYNPLDARCAQAFVANPPDPPQPSTGGRGEVVIDEPCGGREPVFANPGLLGITMPALWDTGTGALDFVALAPTGMRLELLTGPVNPSGGFTVGGINLARLLGGGPNPFDDGEDALLPFALRADSDLVRLDIGGRTVDAWRLDVPAPFGPVYVDGNGSIVRLDVPGAADTQPGAWIRRLRPSEF